MRKNGLIHPWLRFYFLDKKFMVLAKKWIKLKALRDLNWIEKKVRIVEG